MKKQASALALVLLLRAPASSDFLWLYLRQLRYKTVLPEVGRVQLILQAEEPPDIWRFSPSVLTRDVIKLLALNCHAFHVLA